MNFSLRRSDIESSELRVIYRYLVTNLLFSYLLEDSSKEKKESSDRVPIEINFGKEDTNMGK